MGWVGRLRPFQACAPHRTQVRIPARAGEAEAEASAQSTAYAPFDSADAARAGSRSRARCVYDACARRLGWIWRPSEYALLGDTLLGRRHGKLHCPELLQARGPIP